MKYTRITISLLGLGLLLWQVGVQSAGRAQPAPWRLITINAPTQNVEVETQRNTYTAHFQHETVIAANGRATGTLLLTAPDGSQRRVQAFAAVVHWRDNKVQRIRLRTQQTGPTMGDEITFVLYPVSMPAPAPPAPTPTPDTRADCLIYTTVGSGVYVTFEAQGRFTVIR